MNVNHLYMHALQPAAPAMNISSQPAAYAGTPHGMAMSGYFDGVASDHTGALLAPILLPVAIWLALAAVDLAARLGFNPACAFSRAYHGSNQAARLIAGLLLLAGSIHFALVPGHVDHPIFAMLFGLNGLAFVGTTAVLFTWSRWRLPARLLLWATLVAYLVYLATGQETPDLVGSATYLLELLTLALIRVSGASTTKRATMELAPAP